ACSPPSPCPSSSASSPSTGCLENEPMTLNANQKLFGKLALVAVGMFGFGYALVPFYYTICAAWGINSLGEVREAPSSTQVDRSRVVTIEFDSNAHGLPWDFRPLVRHLQVHPGEVAFVEYE